MSSDAHMLDEYQQPALEFDVQREFPQQQDMMDHRLLNIQLARAHQQGELAREEAAQVPPVSWSKLTVPLEDQCQKSWSEGVRWVQKKNSTLVFALTYDPKNKCPQVYEVVSPKTEKRPIK